VNHINRKAVRKALKLIAAKAPEGYVLMADDSVILQHMGFEGSDRNHRKLHRLLHWMEDRNEIEAVWAGDRITWGLLIKRR
jgi:hypothetical protein